MKDVASNEARPAEFVTVTALFGDTVLDTRELAPGGGQVEYVIGEGARATATARGLSMPLFLLARMTRAGCRIAWCDGMSGHATLGGRLVSLDELVARGEVEAQAVGHAWWLPRGASCRIDVGESTFVVQSSTPPERVATPPLRLADRDMLASDGISAAAHGVVLFLLFSVPPSPVDGHMRLPEAGATTRYLARPPTNDAAPEWLNRPRVEPAPEPSRTGPRSSGPRRVAPRLPPGGGPSADQSRRAATGAGILHILSDDSGTLNRLFGGSALSEGATEALDGLVGDTLGAGFGMSGVAFAATGRGGPGSIGYGAYRSGIGPRDGPGGGPPGRLGRHTVRVPSAIPVVATVRGALDREMIRRVVRKNANQIRHCYEAALQRNHEIEGRITVQFLIGANGQVVLSTVQSSDLRDPLAEQCITAAVRRWTFPAPPGGGTVLVNYPFLLRAAGE